MVIKFNKLKMSKSLGILVYVSAVAILLLFAVLSNSLVIFCVAKFKKLRTVTNVLICNLAISDIILAGFVLPQKLHDMFHEEDFYEGDILCKIVNFCPIFIITSSIYILVAVSFERHRAITVPHKSQLTSKKLRILMPVLWIFAFAVSIPTLLEYSVNTILVTDGNGTKTQLSCGSQQTPRELSLANAIFVVVISYIVPVILLFNNYLQVALFVLRKGRQIRDKPGPMDVASFQRFKLRIQLVKLLVVVAVIFAASWLPFFIMLLYAKVTGNDASENATGFVNTLLVALAAFSTAYNVVLYVVFNPSFKRAIKNIMWCTKTQILQEHQRTERTTLHTVAYNLSMDKD